ncbi:hypothetical protein, partial [Pseudomonas sp. FW300-N1A5]|uniref:hypothetical protein n=1 Tax=Pseudomonas sp. FW300-N1A5 TaxID=2070664 RepID=UPI001C47DDE7
FYNAIVKSVPSQAGDNHISRMYQAADVLTYSTSVLSASQRSTSINNYLVFIEAGIVAAILSSYGKADSNGNKTQAISYHTPPAGADMSTV